VNFKPELAAKVMAGEKTVTRRLVSENPRSPWWREQCSLKVDHTYAVCPGRGKNAIGRVRITSVNLEQLGDLDDDEAFREGFATKVEFVDAFAAINGSYDPAAAVWRVEFAVASSADVLVDPLRTQLEPEARAKASGEGPVQDDALALELPLDFGVAGHRAAGDVDEAGLAAVLEIDAPPVAVGVGLGSVAGVFDPCGLHGGSVQATQAAKAGGARPCERLQAVARGRGQSDDGETS
jgi:hypothetical protein